MRFEHPQKDSKQAGGDVDESLGVMLRAKLYKVGPVRTPGAVGMGEGTPRKPPWCSPIPRGKKKKSVREKPWGRCSKKEENPDSTAQWEDVGRMLQEGEGGCVKGGRPQWAWRGTGYNHAVTQFHTHELIEFSQLPYEAHLGKTG